MTILVKVPYKLSAIPIQLTIIFFIKQEQKKLKFLWKHRKSWILETVFRKKNRPGGITLCDFIPYYKSYFNEKVTQSCPTLCNPMDCSLPGSSVHGIFQAIVLEWVAISFSSGSSWPRDGTQVSRIVDRRFTIWATREVHGKIYHVLNWKFQYC